MFYVPAHRAGVLLSPVKEKAHRLHEFYVMHRKLVFINAVDGKECVVPVKEFLGKYPRVLPQFTTVLCYDFAHISRQAQPKLHVKKAVVPCFPYLLLIGGKVDKPFETDPFRPNETDPFRRLKLTPVRQGKLTPFANLK